MKRIITCPGAPGAIGPYSQAVERNGVLYLSGMLGVNPADGAFAGATAAEQAAQALKNICAVLAQEGLSPESVVKTTVFLKDLSAFAPVNGVYEKTFSVNPPARSCVEVARLPKDALVEIECVAVR